MDKRGIAEMKKYELTPHGTIANRGKFETQEPWVVAAYYDYMNGLWEDLDEDIAFAEITHHDCQQFPDHPDFREGSFMVLYFSDQGFVDGAISECGPRVSQFQVTVDECH